MSDTINIVTAVTDIYDKDSVESIKNNLGIDVFSGQTSYTKDVTAGGWTAIAAINAIDKDSSKKDDVLSSLSDILTSQDSNGNVLKYQKTNKDDNLTTQLMIYVKNSSATFDSAVDVFEKLFTTADEKKTQLTSVNRSGISASMVICNDIKLIEGAVDKEFFKSYQDSFYDISYDTNQNLLPLGRLFLLYSTASDDDKATIKSAVEQILDGADTTNKTKWEEFEKYFNPLTSLTSTRNESSINNFITLMGSDNLKAYFAATLTTDNPYYYALTNTVVSNDVDKALGVIVDSVDIDSCAGIKVGETGFSLDNYKTKVNDFSPRVNTLHFLLDILGDGFNVDENLYKYFPPYLFPVPDKDNIEGYTLLSIMCSKIGVKTTQIADSDLKSTVQKFLQAIAKQAEDNAPDGATKLKKFFIFNAYCGTCRDFSGSSTMNLYGPVNLILDKINTVHKDWCATNDKSFDDFKDNYNKIVEDLLTSDYSEILDFDSCYKYWCQEYDKKFD